MTKIYSIQPLAVWEELQKTGVYRPSKKLSFKDHDFTDWVWENAYGWMREQLSIKTKITPDSDHLMVWGWLPTEDVPFNTDLRTSLFRGWSGMPGQFVLMELEIEDSRHLPSDYSYWHSALNYWFLGTEAEDDAFSLKCKERGVKRFGSQYPYPQDLDNEIKQSWLQILDAEKIKAIDLGWGYDSAQPITWQTVFWEIRKEDVVSYKPFKVTKTRK